MRRDAPYLTELPVGATSTDPARGAVPPAAHHLGDGRGPHLHRVRCATYGGLVCFPPKPQNFDKRRQQSEYRDAWRELLRRPAGAAPGAGSPKRKRPGSNWTTCSAKVDASELVDQFQDIIPLCNICHTLKGSIQALRRRAA